MKESRIKFGIVIAIMIIVVYVLSQVTNPLFEGGLRLKKRQIFGSEYCQANGCHEELSLEKKYCRYHKCSNCENEAYVGTRYCEDCLKK